MNAATQQILDDDLREAVTKVASYVDGLPTTATVVPLQVRTEA